MGALAERLTNLAHVLLGFAAGVAAGAAPVLAAAAALVYALYQAVVDVDDPCTEASDLLEFLAGYVAGAALAL